MFASSLTRLMDSMGRGGSNTISVFTYPCTHFLRDMGVSRRHWATPYVAFALLLKYQAQYSSLVNTTYATTHN